MNNLLAPVLFGLLVLAMLALDLGLFQRRAHTPSRREATTWYAAWVGLAVLFNLGVWAWQGSETAVQFLAGYIVEVSLSADNLFVFALIFTTMAIPDRYQHRVLFWGIVGALAMRAIFIFIGVELVGRFHWILYLFGAFLLVAGARLLRQKEVQLQVERHRVLRFVRRLIPLDPDAKGAALFVRTDGRLRATPLFLALILIETTDVLFALDSIPAVFAVTQDPFVIYTSNIFAILGLRALYFLLAGAIARFRYLRPGLAVVLMFLGIKMAVSHFLRIPVFLSLALICGVLVIAITASIRAERKSG